MFDSDKSNSRTPQLGGEIFQTTKKRRKIVTGIVGIFVFIIFNLILYYLTRI